MHVMNIKLVMILMVTAPLMQQGVTVDLPETTTQPLRIQDEPLILTVKKDAKYYIGRKELPADELRAISDNGDCQDELNTDKAMLGCGTMSRIAGPGFNFTVEIDGGINLRVVKAGIRAKLKLAEIQLPLVGKLAFGVADGGGVMVRGEANLDTVFRLISGKIAIYGKIGFRRFARRRTVTLFNFRSKTIRTTLLKRSTNGLQDLQ